MKASVLALMALASGGAQARPPCPAGLKPVTTAQLFFGADDAGRPVGEAEWSGFLASEVTPRFPAGLTVWDAKGQWRESHGGVYREGAKVMLIVLEGRAGERARLAAVIGAYKARFHQRSVLLVERRECASF